MNTNNSNLTYEQLDAAWKKLDHFVAIVQIQANPYTILKLESRLEAPPFSDLFSVKLYENKYLPDNFVILNSTDGRIQIINITDL